MKAIFALTATIQARTFFGDKFSTIVGPYEPGRAAKNE